MTRTIQEKSQVDEPLADDDGGNRWASARSARAKKGTPGREGRAGGDSASRSMDNAVFYGSLPPGVDIEDQEMADHRVFNESTAGGFARGHNAGDVTQDLSAESLRCGYDKKACCPTDDASRERQDTFYCSVVVDGDEGFVERNNVLDRL